MVKQNIRYDTEVRQIGGIMLALSVSIAIYPILDTTSRVSLDIQDNPLYQGDLAALNWALLSGDVAVVILGLLGMGIGFMALTESGHKFITIAGLVWEQTVFIDWIAKMYALSENRESRSLKRLMQFMGALPIDSHPPLYLVCRIQQYW